MCLHPSYYLFYIELSISVSYVFTSASMSEFVIIFSFSPVLTSQLYALYKLAMNVIFAALSLILNYPSFKLAVTVYRGLPTGCFFSYISCNPYVPVWSNNITQHCFWPVKA